MAISTCIVLCLDIRDREGRLTGAAWCFLGALLVEAAGYGVGGEDCCRGEQGDAQGGDGLEHGRRESSSRMACAGLFRARRRGDGVDRGLFVDPGRRKLECEEEMSSKMWRRMRFDSLCRARLCAGTRTRRWGGGMSAQSAEWIRFQAPGLRDHVYSAGRGRCLQCETGSQGERGSVGSVDSVRDGDGDGFLPSSDD